MDFNAFPAQWEWVALILGAVAFMMSIQPFTQLILGRPKLEVKWGARDRGNTRYLDIYIFNLPVRSRFFKMIKVHREKAEGLFAVLSVKNIQTDEICVERIIPRIQGDHQEAITIDLPGTIAPATFLFAVASPNQSAKIYRFKDEKPDPIDLKPGDYELSIEIQSGEIRVNRIARFKVGTHPHELAWEVNTW